MYSGYHPPLYSYESRTFPLDQPYLFFSLSPYLVQNFLATFQNSSLSCWTPWLRPVLSYLPTYDIGLHKTFLLTDGTPFDWPSLSSLIPLWKSSQNVPTSTLHYCDTLPYMITPTSFQLWCLYQSFIVRLFNNRLINICHSYVIYRTKDYTHWTHLPQC